MTKQDKNSSTWKTVFQAPVIVAALGYFVDIYDLVLFSIVRIPSLKSLGLEGQELLDTGVVILNMQMAGMLVGGVLWGILGDRKGRLSVLFGSIFLYSIANFANGFVTSVELYGFIRFIAGVGLAGELGAGITLVAEILPKKTRGLGTMVVAGVGVSGAILAGVIGETLTWQWAYILGGLMGMVLLVLRVGVFESALFSKIKKSSVSRGNFFSLFTDARRFTRYLCCILIGVPIWYVIGILITFSPEIAKALGHQGEVSAGRAIMAAYLGLVIGDFFSGFLSQIWRTRKKVVAVFLGGCVAMGWVYFSVKGLTPQSFYLVCLCLGIAIGYWAIFVTIGAEQFGTNLRSTVATTVPNFVRGSVVPLTLSFQALMQKTDIVSAALIVGVVTILLAFLALGGLKESFARDLDFTET